MKYALLALLALPSLANASVLLGSGDTPLKTCIVEQVSSGLRTSDVRVLSSEAYAQFPEYAEAKLLIDGGVYTVLMMTSDQRGWSNVVVKGQPAISAMTVDSAVLRNNIGKDVITLDLANCGN